MFPANYNWFMTGVTRTWPKGRVWSCLWFLVLVVSWLHGNIPIVPMMTILLLMMGVAKEVGGWWWTHVRYVVMEVVLCGCWVADRRVSSSLYLLKIMSNFCWALLKMMTTAYWKHQKDRMKHFIVPQINTFFIITAVVNSTCN